MAHASEHFLALPCPTPLRAAFEQHGQHHMMAEMMRNARAAIDDDAEWNSFEEMADSMGAVMIRALGPICQRLMVPMAPHERYLVMKWLSEPHQICQHLRQLIASMMEQPSNLSRQMEMMTSIPEVAEALQEELQQLDANADRAEWISTAVAEIKELAEKKETPPPVPPLEPRVTRARRRLACAPRPGTFPLCQLDDDMLQSCLTLLDAASLMRLTRVCRALRPKALQVLRSEQWRAQWGCLPSGLPLQVLTSSSAARLDLSCASLRRETPETHDSPTTRLKLRRLDGPSIGPVSACHVVGIFSEDGKKRLDLVRAVLPQVTIHQTAATCLLIEPLQPGGGVLDAEERRAQPAGDVLHYGQTVGVFSLPDGSGNPRLRLDLGTESVFATKPCKGDAKDDWGNSLRVGPCLPEEDEEDEEDEDSGSEDD